MNQQLPIQIAQCELTTNSATFNPALPWNEWLEAGQQLCKVAGATLWWIGDWINYGEKAYGEKYSQALEMLDYDYQTLRNAAWVCNSIVSTGRQVGLSWSHHREVAHMSADEQARWLNLAVANQWTVSDLRVAIRKHNAVFKDNEPNPGLFKWVDTAYDLDRYLKLEAQKQDPTQWPKERREKVAELLKPIVEFYGKVAAQ